MKNRLYVALSCLALIAFLAGGALAEDKKPAAPTAPAKEQTAPAKACDPKACDPAKCPSHAKGEAAKDAKACDPKNCDPAKCPGHAKDAAAAKDAHNCAPKPGCDPAKCPGHAKDSKAPDATNSTSTSNKAK